MGSWEKGEKDGRAKVVKKKVMKERTGNLKREKRKSQIEPHYFVHKRNRRRGRRNQVSGKRTLERTHITREGGQPEKPNS